MREPRVAVIDYGLGNLFSVRLACEEAGMRGTVTSDRSEIIAADAVILPGVGAFGDAMEALRRADLVQVLRDVAATGMPFVGICLGMQLLMTRSEEFGLHEGLGLIVGDVVRLDAGRTATVKVPHVGWSTIREPADGIWRGTLLDGVAGGAHMYFVHSYAVVPQDESLVLSRTQYGPNDFVSTVRKANVFACQYHPERSGGDGLRIYRNLSSILRGRTEPNDDQASDKVRTA